MRALVRRLALMIVVGAAFACSPSAPAKPSPLAQFSDREALASARETTAVGQTTLSLKASVWRDEMPGTTAHGIQVSATLAAAFVGQAFPAGASIGGIYVLHDDEIWTAGVDEERSYVSSREGVSRGGPSWPAGTSVDVFVRVNDWDGPSTYVAARGIPIVSAE